MTRLRLPALLLLITCFVVACGFVTPKPSPEGAGSTGSTGSTGVCAESEDEDVSTGTTGAV